MSDEAVSTDSIVIEKTFEAPVDLIWQLWTNPEHYKNWYAPEGFSVPVAEMDVRVGGKQRVCMEMPQEQGAMKMWFSGEYKEVVPNKRLVYTDSVVDEDGNILSPADMGMGDDYPMITEVTVVFEDLGERTKMTLTHAGVPADSPGKEGWTQSLNKLENYVKTLV